MTLTAVRRDGKFGGRLLVLGLAAIFAISLAGANDLGATAPETPRDQHLWKIYTNVRFQYSICYPGDLLVPQGESANSDGQRFVAADGATLIVYGSNNALGESLDHKMREISSRLAGATGKVTYSTRRSAWFVVSGTNEEKIFDARVLLQEEQFKAFEFTYESAHANLYTPVVARMAACFVNTAP